MTVFHKLMGSGAVLGLMMAIAAPGLAHAGDGYNGYCYMKKKDARTNGAVIGAVAGGALGGTVSDTKHKGVGTVIGAALGAAVGANVGQDSVKCYNGAYYSFQHGQYDPPAPPEGYETVYYRSQPGETYYSHVEYQAYSNQGYASQGYSGQGYAGQGAGYETPAQVDDGYGHRDLPPPPPPPPPSGQRYYTQTQTYTQGYGNAPARRDDYGAQDQGQPGWQDDEGRWHRGHPRAIGWQDDDGTWHEGTVVRYGWRDRDGHWHESHDPDQDVHNNGY